MSTTVAAIVGCVLSLPPLLWLAWRDPKRLRSLRRRPMRPAVSRGLVAILLLVPGLLLAAGGLWPAFLIWFGSLAVGGWIFTLLLAGA